MTRVARRSAAWVQPWRRSWASRQARMTAADTSMPESRPKPTRLTDPAATPATTATRPSTAFQPMVSRLSSRPRRTAAARTAGLGPRGMVVMGGAPGGRGRPGCRARPGPARGGRRPGAGWPLIADLAAFPGGGDQPAAAQTGQVIGGLGPAHAKDLGELGWVGRTGQQHGQDAPAGRVGQGGPDALQDIHVGRQLGDHSEDPASATCQDPRWPDTGSPRWLRGGERGRAVGRLHLTRASRIRYAAAKDTVVLRMLATLPPSSVQPEPSTTSGERPKCKLC
jgi:hypothetical protein